ncbi:sensor histidine kinase [Pseudoalteromonas sp. S16_S37]|uniref:sensor histidine kinase n=1 Tax=Pseudoalteromonas sp. S16_S37 TaxID=2720228 RepID=UPI0016819BBE|nr:HAMP domain-containing sensor histidine kinase [Pseudoalteromonas sp. S16_S37]MBD1584353.1 HAMP domain-containing histidine kinase [Pseudoalteromonas sp. S16_S37]
MKYPIKYFAQLKTSLFCWLVLSALTLIVTEALKLQLENEQTAVLQHFQDEVIELYEEVHIAGIMSEFEMQTEALFNEQQSYTHLKEEGILVALFSDNRRIAGSQLLLMSQQQEVTPKKIIFNDLPVYKIEFDLDDQYSLVIVKTPSDTFSTANTYVNGAAFWMIWLSLPLLLSIFNFIQFRQNRTANSLARAIIAITSAPDTKRLSANMFDKPYAPVIHAINQMLDDVTTLHTNMKTMSVGIAHDLKTPLTRVANRMQSIYQDLNSPERIASHLEQANSDLQSTITTFNNLVRLNAIESGQHKQGFVKLDLSKLAKELGESYDPVFIDAEKSLEVSIVDNIHCFGDVDLLNQLISNLLENALEYSREGATVWLRIQSHTNGALLQIGDDGPGIEKSQQRKVFQRFYRVDKSRSTPGNGLGLSIVKAICDIHNANITLLDEQCGAVFNIEIPTLVD